MCRLVSLLSITLSLLAFPFIVQAEGFGINATRLIYPQGSDSINVTVRNTMKNQPYLVQAALSASQDENKPTPFAVTPPLFRLEPSSVHQIRIASKSANLPTDRESVFYFHATAIPASSAPNAGNQRSGVSGSAQFGVGSIIKLFYRPENLAMSVKTAQQSVKFSRVANGIKATNSSPYYISFANIRIGNETLQLNSSEALMLAPFSSYTHITSNTKNQVRWEIINDEGGRNEFSSSLE